MKIYVLEKEIYLKHKIVVKYLNSVIIILLFQRNLTEYYSAVDSHNMMMIFASMLYERRIIFISKRLSRLSACVQACNALIYPMIWQHIYIPVLPLSLIDYLLAPMPFLIGVPTLTLQVSIYLLYIYLYTRFPEFKWPTLGAFRELIN